MVDVAKIFFKFLQTPRWTFLHIFIKVSVLAAAFLFLYYVIHLFINVKHTYHIAPDVIAIEGLFNTAYLIRSDEGYILVDTGFDSRVMTKALSINKIDANEVKILLLTHSDFDHHFLAGLFPKAKIYLSRDELSMVQSKKQRLFFIPFLHNYLPEGEFNLLDEGSVVDLGGRKISCVLLPGHTLGSMGYILDQKYLFSGDAFRLKKGKISMPYVKLLVMDTGLMSQSIKKLEYFTGIQYIFTANSNFISLAMKSSPE
jgi:hydroxyacylglutathione hydrolase